MVSIHKCDGAKFCCCLYADKNKTGLKASIDAAAAAAQDTLMDFSESFMCVYP